MKELKEDVALLKSNLKAIETMFCKRFEERKLDITYEIEKARLESSFNARNIFYILLLLFPFTMSLVFGYGIYKYFEFEKQNMNAHIEVESISDHNSHLINSINNRTK